MGLSGPDSSIGKTIATGVLSLGVLFPLASLPLLHSHIVAVARAARPAPHTVRLVAGTDDAEIKTTEATVADLLRARGIVPGPDDTVDPAPETVLTDDLTITYRAAFPVTLVVAGARQTIMSSARDVAALLQQRGITLGTMDRVEPASDTPLASETALVRVIHTTEWIEVVRENVAPVVEHRLSLALKPTASKVVSAGTAAVRESVVSYSTTDDEQPVVDKKVLQSRIVSKGKPKVVMNGVVAYDGYAALVSRGFQGTLRLANAAFRMVATAYTANCSGCSGYTAMGARAGHGIVAVDPSVIPLGTRLYIPGYGRAIAGDTGGAIRGSRIDLGFDSSADAMSFGRRVVHVYVLK